MPRVLDSVALEGKEIIKIIAGRGRSGALTSEGELFIWGHRASHVPTLLSPKLIGGRKITTAAFGGDIMGNSCNALVTEDGLLWTFGDVGSFMLGRNIALGQTGLSRQPEPMVVEGGGLKGRRVREVFMGSGQHAIATVESGTDQDLSSADL